MSYGRERDLGGGLGGEGGEGDVGEDGEGDRRVRDR